MLTVTLSPWFKLPVAGPSETLSDSGSSVLAILAGFMFTVVLVASGVALENSGWLTRVLGLVRKSWKTWKGQPTARCRLVGSGPGDPALLTVAARRALSEADLVIVDQLVPDAIVALIRGRIIMSPKAKGCANRAQNQLHEWLVEALENGEDVVRLKGGDPFLFGRGAEEIKAAHQHGFAVEVVPGISSALAAPLAAGIAVTTRGVANQLIIATASGKNDTVPREPAHFDSQRTAVFLMSVSRMEALVDRLRKRCAYPGDTPVVVVERATLPGQRVVRGPLYSIAALCRAENIASPATIMIGRSVNALPCASYVTSSGATCFPAPKKSLP